MAASPYQPTHWLRLRVDLGLELHSGMDSQLELDRQSALPALLCDVVVMACAHTGEGLVFLSGPERVLRWIS